MATVADAMMGWETEASGLAFARDVLRIEAEALRLVRERLDPSIAHAAEQIYRSRGSANVIKLRPLIMDTNCYPSTV